ncbi:vesicle-associated protein 2-2-like isoform X1 [Carica papaya]|uniref:vesicle-associated protein 2-2-like isoform X1 n=2 Tax=Carica papaya TaxID=3649 RepID=UPI000B8C8B29|nr:vesicle-associated protein 2-2-like isoform X1 [Carica papaya]
MLVILMCCVDMTTELLDIQPGELKFEFELKKQGTCSIQLNNKSDHFVSFKVKTTSPKKYCVRPNTGIIKPKTICDCIVTMQAQRVAPPGLECKDKFLIQSIVVPFGATDEDITSDMFGKNSGRCIEEKKLRVFLLPKPPSQYFLPVNGELKQDRLLTGIENVPPPLQADQNVERFDTPADLDELKTANKEVIGKEKDADQPNAAKNLQDARAVIGTDKLIATEEDVVNAKDADRLDVAKHLQGVQAASDVDKLIADKDEQSCPAEDLDELEDAKDDLKLKLAKEFVELKSKLHDMDSKLREAELIITNMTEEGRMATQERDKLRHEVLFLRRNNSTIRRTRVGFPLLYVCAVALISLGVGYFSHS